MGEDWTLAENEIIVSNYFEMLLLELDGIPFNKSEHRRKIEPLLNRSHKSLENKHQNISAILYKIGLPHIKGYAPYGNFQKLTEQVILEYLERNKNLEKEFMSFATAQVTTPKQVDFKNWEEKPPKPKKIKEPTINFDRVVKRNYLEIEQRNRATGDAGEQLVFDYEKWRLSNLGFSKLAKQIVWVSKEEGDGAGYDILSKNINGSNIYIEVKSTKSGIDTPIFFSKKENEFSKIKNSDFYLYRVFDLKREPKFFYKNGRLEDICKVEAINFRGLF